MKRATHEVPYNRRSAADQMRRSLQIRDLRAAGHEVADDINDDDLYRLVTGREPEKMRKPKRRRPEE